MRFSTFGIAKVNSLTPVSLWRCHPGPSPMFQVDVQVSLVRPLFQVPLPVPMSSPLLQLHVLVPVSNPPVAVPLPSSLFPVPVSQLLFSRLRVSDPVSSSRFQFSFRAV